MHVRVCVCAHALTPMCVGNITQRKHTRQLHFTVESSGSNILAEWTSNLPNDLRAVKDIAANSNCKKYIGFRRGMTFGRLCFKTMLGERKIEGCSSHSEIITMEALVQSWRCEEKLKVSFSVYQIYSRCCRERQLQEGLRYVLGQGFDHAISLPSSSPVSSLSSSTLQGGRRHLNPNQEAFSNATACRCVFCFDLVWTNSSLWHLSVPESLEYFLQDPPHSDLVLHKVDGQ